MSQSSSDKYMYFTVGILKDSQTLEALREDAVKHHMIDYPGQLIALRLAEYYEMMQNVTVQPVIRVPEPAEAEEKERFAPTNPAQPAHPMQPMQPMHPVQPVHFSAPVPVPMPPGAPARSFTPVPPVQSPLPPHLQPAPFTNQSTGRMRPLRKEHDSVISTSPNADQNADEAADYWNAL